jgi:hypothetical protein
MKMEALPCKQEQFAGFLLGIIFNHEDGGVAL